MLRLDDYSFRYLYNMTVLPADGGILLKMPCFFGSQEHAYVINMLSCYLSEPYQSHGPI